MVKKTPKPVSSVNRLAILAVFLGIIGLGLISLIITHHNNSISEYDSSEQIVDTVNKKIIATKVKYKTNIIRSDNRVGTYMRPYKPKGYNFAVFPSEASILQLSDPGNDGQKIDVLLSKSFTKKVINDKTVKMAVEYDSTLTVCYLEFSKPEATQTNIFGCADKLSYLKNATQIEPIIGSARDFSYDTDVYDTPGIFHGSKAGYDAALVPVTVSPYVLRGGYTTLDIMQTTNLTASNRPYYHTPAAEGWIPTNYFGTGYRTANELCTSPDMENPDVKIAFSKVCEQLSSKSFKT